MLETKYISFLHQIKATLSIFLHPSTLPGTGQSQTTAWLSILRPVSAQQGNTWDGNGE